MIILDIDDTIAHLWSTKEKPFKPIDPDDLVEFFRLLKNEDVFALTNRPPSQMGIASAFFSGKFHIMESGGSAWLPVENKLVINPKYINYLPMRKQIVNEVNEQEEYGQKQVAICFLNKNANIESIKDYPVDIKQGDGLDVFPKGMTKKDGCKFFEKLYKKYYKEIDWSEAIFFGDSQSDIPAINYIKSKGGRGYIVKNIKDIIKILKNEN